MLRSSSSSWSKDLTMWSAMAVILVRCASAEAAGDVVLGATIGWGREHLHGLSDLDQVAKIEEGRDIGATGRLLHVVRDDDDGEVTLQFIDQFLDLGGRDRIERRR